MLEHIQRSWGSNLQSLTCTSRMLPLSHDAPQTEQTDPVTRAKGSASEWTLARHMVLYRLIIIVLSLTG